MGHQEHRKSAPGSVKVFVITASDTRGEAEDSSGRLLRDGAAAGGHQVVGYRLVKDEPDQIRAAREEAARAGAQAVLVNGGTGISGRDRSYEAVAGLLEKRIEGFGEVFRMLSFQEFGSAANYDRQLWRAGVLHSHQVISNRHGSLNVSPIHHAGVKPGYRCERYP